MSPKSEKVQCSTHEVNNILVEQISQLTISLKRHWKEWENDTWANSLREGGEGGEEGEGGLMLRPASMSFFARLIKLYQHISILVTWEGTRTREQLCVSVTRVGKHLSPGILEALPEMGCCDRNLPEAPQGYCGWGMPTLVGQDVFVQESTRRHRPGVLVYTEDIAAATTSLFGCQENGAVLCLSWNGMTAKSPRMTRTLNKLVFGLAETFFFFFFLFFFSIQYNPTCKFSNSISNPTQRRDFPFPL